MRKPNYDKFPFVAVPASEEACVAGWDAIAERLSATGSGKRVITIECYAGVHERQIVEALQKKLKAALCVLSSEALLPEEKIQQLCEPFLGGDDPIFGWLAGLSLPQFFDPEKLRYLRSQIENCRSGPILVVGTGARLVHPGDVLVYADLARWEAQMRQRRGEIGNLGCSNLEESAGLKYKRAFFIDWRVCDRWKKPLLPSLDFLLDTNNPQEPKLVEGAIFRAALAETARRPFRVVPFFDPGPWGGQWMKEVCDLDRSTINYAWCFDCVPEENSLLLGFGSQRVEIPSIDVVFDQPEALLGEAVHARFGDEFPIRFDFLDTMGGGNLSLQVHPLTEYIQNHFGMHYTQDESYYMLDAGADACVYLGFREGVDPERCLGDLEAAQRGERPFDDGPHVAKWPARKHDHFLIPAGTIHCSGANSMVLEISATPYIFTFKLWDWGRLGLDGKPRPINIERGKANLKWNRTENWVAQNLINRVTPLAAGDGWREERTGLHEREFIETRRHWFSRPVVHRRTGSVEVLNLVEGEEAVVESCDNAWAPFVVHYAETFILPAAAGDYSIRPGPNAAGSECATVKAYVRF